MRDNRDPQAIGLCLERLRANHPLDAIRDTKLSKLLNTYELPNVPDYDEGVAGPLERYGNPKARVEHGIVCPRGCLMHPGGLVCEHGWSFNWVKAQETQ